MKRGKLLTIFYKPADGGTPALRDLMEADHPKDLRPSELHPRDLTNLQGPSGAPFLDPGSTQRHALQVSRRTPHPPRNPSELLPGLERAPDMLRGTRAAEVQESRQAIGRQLAAVIAGGPVAFHPGGEGPVMVNTETGEVLEDEGAAFAALLHLAAEDENHVAGLMEQDGGGTFFGGMALWKSSLRLDPNWMETFRRRSRSRARLALRAMMEALPDDEKMARRFGWKHRLTLKLLTLTMPRIRGKSQIEEVRRLQLAWALFRKRDFWKDRSHGGMKGVEDAIDADGSHVHAHVLILSRFFQRDELREEWRECVDSATRQAYGFGLAEDAVAVVDIRTVTRRTRGPRPDRCTLDEALDETTKYVTKPSDFLTPDDRGRTVPRETLLEICRVPRWPRMFELLGKARFRLKKARSTGSKLAQAALAALVSIHRAYLTAGPSCLPPDLRAELADRGAFDVDDDASCLRRTVEHLIDLSKSGRPRGKPPSWRELMGAIPFGDWLQMVANRAKRGRGFRIRWILDHHPRGIFAVFDGSVLVNPDPVYADGM